MPDTRSASKNGAAVPPRPEAPTPQFASVPPVLVALVQWVLWRYDWNHKRGEWAKVPYNARTRQKADSTDPATWSDFDTARTSFERGGFAGVGFVFAADGNLTGVDLDGCIDPETGEVLEWAQPWLDAFDTYQEISPSGTGVKLFCQATKPDGAGCKKALPFPSVGGKDAAVEAYDRVRFFAVTGAVFGPVRLVADCQSTVDAFCAEYLPSQKAAPKAPRPASPSPLSLDDGELLRRAFAAKNGSEVFALYSGNIGAYNGDQSAADLGLCCHLAFWSGGDAARLDAWFRSSALFRDKWDEQRGSQTYGERTLEKALAGCAEFYDPSSFAPNKSNKSKSAPVNGTNGNTTVKELIPGMVRRTGQAWQTAGQTQRKLPFLGPRKQ